MNVHTTNDLPTFSPQKQNLEIGPSERLLPVFGTKNRILKNGSSERALSKTLQNLYTKVAVIFSVWIFQAMYEAQVKTLAIVFFWNGLTGKKN